MNIQFQGKKIALFSLQFFILFSLNITVLIVLPLDSAINTNDLLNHIHLIGILYFFGVLIVSLLWGWIKFSMPSGFD